MRTAALLGVTLLLLAACGPSPSTPRAEAARQAADAKTVAFADYGLSLQVPAHWQAQENISGLRWYARPTADGKPLPGAYLTLLRDEAARSSGPGEAPTLEGYAAFKLEQEARNAQSHQVLSTATVSVDGVAGTLWLTEYASKTHRWQTWSLFAVKGEQGYTLTATALKDDADRLEPAYRAIINSLRWLPADKN